VDHDRLPYADARRPPNSRRCRLCGSWKFEVHVSDFYPAVRPSERGHRIYQTVLWFGSGSEARRLLIIDREVYCAAAPKLSPNTLLPCRAWQQK
jgi:hypothetical protein